MKTESKQERQIVKKKKNGWIKKMQRSSIDGTGKLYELMFPESIRLFRDSGIRN